MALKHVRPNSAGSRHKSRWVTRAEAKASGRRARRTDDRAQTLLRGAHETAHDEMDDPELGCLVCLARELVCSAVDAATPKR